MSVVVWKGKASYRVERKGKLLCGRASYRKVKLLGNQIDEHLNCDSEVDIGVLIDCFGQEFGYFIGV